MNRRVRIGDHNITIGEKHTNICANSAQLGRYYIVGASVRGRLHAHNKVPRDDAFAARSNSNGTWLAVAVSDGVGSRKLSRYGASFAVNRLCTRFFNSARNLKHNGLDEILGVAFHRTRADMEIFALKNNVSLKELHCTLLGLFLNMETGAIGIGQIGDGLILGLTKSKRAVPLVDPPVAGEVGETYVLTQSRWEQHFYSRVLPPEGAQEFKTFYLMTDGVADDCQYGPPPDILQRWANDMNQEIRMFPPVKTAMRLRKYLASYQVKGSFDDRTLVVIYRQKGD